MRPPLLAQLALLLAVPAAQAQPQRPSRPVPTLAAAPRADGVLQEGRRALRLPLPPGAPFQAQVAVRGDTLWVGVHSPRPPPAGVRLTLFAPGAGVTAQGVTYAFGRDGRPLSPPASPLSGAGVPQQVRTGVKEAQGGYAFEALLPAQALPRFPWRGPLQLELCVEVAGASNCQGGTMQGPLLRLPDSFRAALKLSPPRAVASVEGRPQGWVGWDAREQLVWAAAGQALDAATLRALVAPGSLDPRSLHIALPPTLALPDGAPLVALFEGKDPQGEGGACRGDEEVRLRLFVLRGPAAHRVLDWPAVSCQGGRARSVVLDEEGDLSIGYSTGAILHFLWSGDHFERTEIGLR